MPNSAWRRTLDRFLRALDEYRLCSKRESISVFCLILEPNPRKKGKGKKVSGSSKPHRCQDRPCNNGGIPHPPSTSWSPMVRF